QFANVDTFTKNTLSNEQKTCNLDDFKLKPDINKKGKIDEQLSKGKTVLVQVAKEPISTKGPRLTSEISLAGRYLILVPFTNHISVSQSIKDKNEVKRLKRLLKSIKPDNFGLIIRTAAMGQRVKELDSDLKELKSRWNATFQSMQNSQPPKRILGELNKVSALLRDFLNENFSKIYTNEKDIYNEIKDYLSDIAPDKENIVKFYKGGRDIFDAFDVQKQIKAAFGKKVILKSGAYLIIEHTEAMHVVDVNSGKRKKPEKSQEENALEVNIEAAYELARILRLRDMGGIIMVDFIDMYEKKNQKKLYDKFREFLKSDKAKHKILPPSRFGVVELTRERVKPETVIQTSEECPVCKGSGKVQSTLLLTDEIENNLRYIIEDMQVEKVSLHVHPYIAAYLKKGLFSFQSNWYFQYKKWVSVHPEDSYHLLEYRFFDGNGQEIES
ncbi:MAG: Rne/Rng family ribonuclease, partial [Flavobacteriales bacterium]